MANERITSMTGRADRCTFKGKDGRRCILPKGHDLLSQHELEEKKEEVTASASSSNDMRGIDSKYDPD